MFFSSRFNLPALHYYRVWFFNALSSLLAGIKKIEYNPDAGAGDNLCFKHYNAQEVDNFQRPFHCPFYDILRDIEVKRVLTQGSNARERFFA